jgi:hypothetical protein
MKLRTTAAIALAMFASSAARSDDADKFFVNSYAVVIGIDTYASASWPKLTYAVSDAKAVAGLLRSQGFKVTELLEAQATKSAILAALDDKLAPVLDENDRVILFFAGHGTSRVIGNAEHGYLIPADGGDSGSFSSFIPLKSLHDISDTMAAARHQLFILDSCFGGLAAMRSGGNETLDARTSNYLYEISRRKARQLLTAGGKDQRVRDGGPDGHSFFVGELLKAVRDGMADGNPGDGFVTFNELTAFIIPAASTYNQTPGSSSMAGHEQGEFWFRSMSKPPVPVASPRESSPSTAEHAYAELRLGKQAFLAAPPDYTAARQHFLTAASEGNAEAMSLLGKLYWDGLGGTKSESDATRWFESSAQRGNTRAMENLIAIYAYTRNEIRQKYWQQILTETQRLEARITVSDPSQAARLDPSIPQEATRAKVPSPVTNLTVQ